MRWDRCCCVWLCFGGCVGGGGGCGGGGGGVQVKDKIKHARYLQEEVCRRFPDLVRSDQTVRMRVRS